MKVKHSLLAVTLIIFSGCNTYKSNVELGQETLNQYPNLVESTPGRYLEIIGLKSLTAQQVLDSLRATQPERILENNPLSVCAVYLKKDLGFDHASAIQLRNNYGFVKLIESADDYGIRFTAMPEDSMPVIREWLPASVNPDSQNIMVNINFAMQFLRTDGHTISMKNKAIYKQFATPEEKAVVYPLIEHLNNTKVQAERSLITRVLEKDRNPVNRTLAVLMLMRVQPDDNEISLLFRELLVRNAWLSGNAFHATREILKQKKDTDWESVNPYIRSILNGGGIWYYEQFLGMLAERGYPAHFAEEVLTGESPLLRDHLRAYYKSGREKALKFVRHMSENKIKTVSEADAWLLNTYSLSKAS